MALRFIDGFDHYASAQLTGLRKYEFTLSGSASPAISTGRYGSGLQLTNSNTNAETVRKTFNSQGTWIIGFDFFVTNVPNSTPQSFFVLLDGTSSQLSLEWTPAAKIQLTTAAGSFTGATTIVLNTWYFFEVKVVISNTGSYEFRIDGTTQLSGGPVDTQATSNSTANGFQFVGPLGTGNGTYTYRIDDIYALDGNDSGVVGLPNNDFLGECKVECLFPSGNGNSSQFDGSDGNSTDNYLLVDETIPDDDTTYVESPDVGDEDTYAYGNLTTSAGTVIGVQPLACAEKTNAGARQIVTVARVSGTETNSLAQSLNTSYLYKYDIRETKPGGGAWTISDVNSAEFGVKVSG